MRSDQCWQQRILTMEWMARCVIMVTICTQLHGRQREQVRGHAASTQHDENEQRTASNLRTSRTAAYGAGSRQCDSSGCAQRSNTNQTALTSSPTKMSGTSALSDSFSKGVSGARQFGPESCCEGPTQQGNNARGQAGDRMEIIETQE